MHNDLVLAEKSTLFVFATFVCSIEEVERANLLNYMLKSVKSNYSLVAILNNFTCNSLDEDITAVVIPKKEPCENGKLHVWNLTMYKKIVFLALDLFIVANVDDLFDYDATSAVKLVGNYFSSSLIVLEPDLQSSVDFRSLLSQKGEALILEKGNNLPQIYNTPIQYKSYAIWSSLKPKVRIFRFSKVNPWNFYFSMANSWSLFLDPSIFYSWTSLSDKLNTKHLIASKPNGNYEGLCQVTSKWYSGKKFTLASKFSILIGTFDRPQLLEKALLHYSSSKNVHSIYVTWHNPRTSPSEALLKMAKKLKIPVYFLFPITDSLNNRFNVAKELSTKAVLVCDEDIKIPIGDVDFAFEVWKTRTQSLVGVIPRAHFYDLPSKTWQYDTLGSNSPLDYYTMILTKFVFMNSEFLYLYTCLLPSKIHQYVDSQMNCEDIALNLMVSGLTGSPPVLVQASIEDYGTTSGISGRQDHLKNRSKCVNDLLHLFGKDLLLPNTEQMKKYRQ